MFQLIYKHWMNTLMGYCGPFMSESGYCERLKTFISANLQWVQDQVEKQPASPYWHQVIFVLFLLLLLFRVALAFISAFQVRLALLQLKGLEDGYYDQLYFPTERFNLNPLGFL